MLDWLAVGPCVQGYDRATKRKKLPTPVPNRMFNGFECEYSAV